MSGRRPYNEIMASTTVLLFNCCAASHLAARLHAADCAMVKMATGSRGKVRVIAEDLDYQVADLTGRGWQVKRCKCLKG
jgi:hypothetical protein